MPRAVARPSRGQARVGFTPVLALERLVDNPVVLLEGPRPVGLVFKEASPMPPCMTSGSVTRGARLGLVKRPNGAKPSNLALPAAHIR